MKMKKVGNKRLENSFDKPECAFEDDADDDFETMETACAHCLRKAQLAQLRAISGKDSEIRMSGYLKKKRDSITGGWRKLYFVLRNRFLLSYRSRDVYEPIKDIIRLDTGMAIVPSAGLRFEIMLNGYALYTLRCDSQQTFSQWITVLLDSFVNARSEATYERKLSQKKNLQWSTTVPRISSEESLTNTTDKATAATDGGSREVRPVKPARKSLKTGHINVPKLTLLSDDEALNSNALPQPVENEKRQEHKAKNKNDDNKQTKITGCGEADHQRTEEVITQSFQFPDKSKLSSNISENSVPEQYIHIYSPVMGDQSFGTESGTLPMIMRQSTMRNTDQRTSRSCSDLPTMHTAVYKMNTLLSESSAKVTMHSYTSEHEYVSVLPKPNNTSVAPPSPNITLRENKIREQMSPIYATIDVIAKKHRRAQLQQLAFALPISIKHSNSDDELPLLTRAASERSITVDDSGCNIYEEIENILPAVIVNPKSSDSDVNVSNVPKTNYIEKTTHLSTLTEQPKYDYEQLSNEPLVSVPDPKNQNSGNSSVYPPPPLYEDIEPLVAATDTTEKLMIMRKNDNSGTEHFYEEILFPPTTSGEALSRTKSMLLPAGNKTAQSSTTKHGRSLAHTFWKMLKRVPFSGSSHRRKESTRDSGQQQSPKIFVQGNGRTMDGYSRKGRKKSLRKRIMKSLTFDKYDYPNSSSSRSINNSLYNDQIIIQNVQNGIMTTEI